MRVVDLQLRWVSRAVFASGVFLASGSAQAAGHPSPPPPLPPSISITSPTPGPLYDVRPTMAVAYMAGDAPLDLDSLRILVNTSDWTGRFTRAAAGALYVVSTEDALAAGTLTIEASIAGVDGLSASATQQYEVFPTLQEVNPSAGREGDEVTVTGLGLDSAPERNVLRFRSPFDANGVDAPFTAVDRTNNQGVVKVPADAITGPVRLVVNGKPSRETIPFVVPSLIPCRTRSGNLDLFASMPDGGWVLRGRYYGDPDARCPLLPNPPNPVYVDGAVIRVPPEGDAVLLDWARELPDRSGQFVYPLVDRNDLGLFRVIRPWPWGPTWNLEVEIRGVVTRLGSVTFPVDHGFAWAAFDAKGNLYIAHHNAEAILLLSYVPKDQLVGGSVVPTVVATNLDPVPPRPNPQGQPQPAGAFGGLHLSCDGFAYLPFNYGTLTPPAYNDYRIRKLALPSGAVVGDVEVQNRWFMSLARSCHSDELWGSAMTDVYATDTEYFRAESGPAGIGSPVPMDFVPDAWANSVVVVGPDGSLYADHGVRSESGLSVIRLRPRVEPCDQGGGVFDARAICNRLITILPTTTRWRPQKDTTRDVDIYFEYRGEGKLTSATATIAGPSPVAPITIPILPGDGNPYKITWSGPWITDPGNPVSYLARGPYTIVVTAVKEDGTTVASGPFDANGSVSLVEVNSIRLEPVEGSHLDENPGPCPQPPGTDPNCTVPASGKRIFAEAVDPVEVDPNAPVYDKVSVVATIDPPVDNLRGQGPIKVYFHPLDVDDPAPAGLIDAEAGPTDNRGSLSIWDENGVEVWNATLAYPIPVLATQARTNIRVSQRQGDNYRLAASTAATWPMQTSAVIGSQTGEVLHEVDPAVPEGIQLTEMLTVWRTLHVERARFGPGSLTQDNFQLNGTWTGVNKKKLEDDDARPFFGWKNTDGIADHTTRNGWRGADVNPYAPAGNDFLVTKNGNRSVRTDAGDMRPVANPADRRYYLRDDKLSSLTTRNHDTSILRAILKGVYIDVEEVDSVPPVHSFVHNLTQAAHFAMTGAFTNSAAYWNIPMLLAFEAELAEDDDPTNEGAGPGGLDGPFVGRCKPGDQPFAAVFAEAVRDFHERGHPCIRPTVGVDELYASNTAHELLHGMGLIHEGDATGGIMCATFKNYVVNGDARKDITEGQRAFLRGIPQPFFDPGETSCPPLPPCP